jgi:hypothetical protein
MIKMFYKNVARRGENSNKMLFCLSAAAAFL